MKLKIAAFLVLASLSSCSQQINLGSVLDEIAKNKPLTDMDISNGLKEALAQGITKGALKASALDGFLGNSLIKIPFPPEVAKVESALRGIGLGSQVDKFVTALNRGAEQAASKATPIFISAIKQMTFKDAIGILKGGPDAATQYLIRTTTPQLLQAFSPVVASAIEKTSATKYYGDLATAYNAIPFTKKVNTDLQAYATQKAVDGLFTMVAKEETKIRENPLERTTDLMRRVFGSIGK